MTFKPLCWTCDAKISCSTKSDCVLCPMHEHMRRVTLFYMNNKNTVQETKCTLKSSEYKLEVASNRNGKYECLDFVGSVMLNLSISYTCSA